MLLSACHQIMGISRHFIKISYKNNLHIAMINNFCKKILKENGQKINIFAAIL